MRALLIGMTLLTFGATHALAEPFITILTGGISGVYYPLGVSLSDIYAKAIPDAKTSVQATKASVENLNLLQNGRGEVAFALGDTIGLAWAGNADAGFPQKLDRLRGIAALYPNYLQVVASADSGIRTLGDLRGKRVSVGAPKSGTEINARTVLTAAGVSFDDFAKVEHLGFAESVDLMKNRQLDVTLQSAGLGVSSIRELATAIDITLVPIPVAVVATINDPAYRVAIIPAATYQGQNQAVPTVEIENFLVTSADVDGELVYRMTKAMFENLDLLASAHVAARAIKIDSALAGMPVPLHPGAARFYREKGMLP
ncbi:MAG: TAXI family TRAP transporter solute-binding subunit [Rhodospirillales bacterium]